MISTEREFAKMCINRGFARLAPRFYGRCIGDGIYQTIYTGSKKYVDPHSPCYSTDNRKAHYVSIGLRSMYSLLSEDVFCEGKGSGGYRPFDLYKGGKHTGPFNGIQEDYSLMEQMGFDVLDEIATQEMYLEWWERVEVMYTGHRVHDLRLVEPFLLCSNLCEAEHEISVSFIQGASACESYRERVQAGLLASDPSYEERIQQGAKRKMTLWHWCQGRKYQELQSYIQNNYQRNMEWVQQYGVSTVLLTQQRTLDPMLFGVISNSPLSP